MKMKGRCMMGRFLNGMFIGAGIALLVAPMRGEDMRALLRERFAALQGSLPENEQLHSYGKQATSQAQKTTESVHDLAQRSAKKAPQAGQGEVGSLKQGTETRGPTTTPFPPASPEYVHPETQTNG
jgi:gas vesicle protein